MKRLFATFLLSCAAGLAGAQSLPQGVTLDALQAMRDNGTGQTMITGTLHNGTGRLLNSAAVVFTLYDAQGNKVGEASDITYNLPNGGNWGIRATATQPFTRFTAFEVRVQ
ncbi:FxLYD domain-containing protein [Achromobacter aloeverae]|uniref:Uncharacterized protein n=1 Tax=Achromobacter aloeverae TaxID=1750518 RepID=A0A4Q1HKB3_9BURK|nr:FxLYD domain-containing protein [Achromobacter aloeverae]RXN90379.1 hypothetical protein C7R54_12790 [Achromobacter aloeverae]